MCGVLDVRKETIVGRTDGRNENDCMTMGDMRCGRSETKCGKSDMKCGKSETRCGKSDMKCGGSNMRCGRSDTICDKI